MNVNESNNLSFEKVDEEKDIPEKKIFVLLNEEKKSYNILSEVEWESILKMKRIGDTNKDKIILSLKSGIPSKLRGKIWKFLSKSVSISLNHDREFYDELIKIKNYKIELQIKKDIERTKILDESNTNANADNIMKKKLFNILKAYGTYDSLVGYCQGMNFIVSIILANINSEKDAFWLFVQIMHDKNWRYLFINNTPKLIKILEQFSKKLKVCLNDLYEHFEQENVKI